MEAFIGKGLPLPEKDFSLEFCWVAKSLDYLGATQGRTKAAATHSAKESLNLESTRRVRYA